jgi:CheY-like chemotaxis protein
MNRYKKVIVIDDSALERFLTEKRLSIAQFADAVVCFESAVEALAYLQSLNGNLDLFPEIIFTDIHMPIMNGFEFLDKFLEFSEPILRHCKIVMISSTDADEDHVRMRNYPIIRRFLRKPLFEDTLRDLVIP